MFKKTLLSVGDGIISTDHYGKIVMLNPIAQKFIHLRSKETNGKSLEEIFTVLDNKSYKPVGNIALEVISKKKAIQLKEGILNNHLEEHYHIEYSATPIEDINGIEDGVVIVFRDISERVERLHEIEYLSYHDYLTGLYNRRYYEEFIKRLDKKDCPIS
jgi:diguanylate cyclase